jgi:asparagine synthase (glutamine-hydrolysing)
VSGIAVVYDPSNRNEETQALVPRMCQALQSSEREGPVEWYSRPGFAIGRCRPVLINQASQPAWNEQKTICAFFHGELFGCQDLKRSLGQRGHQFSGDSHAEFVIHLYEDRGDAFVHELDGSFAMALWDSRQGRLLVVNDRYGLRPLYTAQSAGKFLWTSAPKAILAHTTFPRRINLAAMADFLCLGIPQGNDTMFEGIDELPPASLVICQEGQVHWQQYWDLSLQDEETGVSANDYLDEMIALLRQAAERRQTGGLSVGLLLSGGLDSRIALSVLSKDALKTFTYGPTSCDDVQFARQVAKVARVPHFALEIAPDYLEAFARTGVERMEDLVNCDHFHGISVYDEIASHVNTLVTGTTAEGILGGSHLDPRGPFWGNRFSVDRFYDSKRMMTDEELGQLIKPVYFRQMAGLARARFHGDFKKCPSTHTANKVVYWYFRQAHRRRVNRASSLFPDNLEYRPLAFDKDLMRFAQTIPPSLRWGENPVYRQVIFRTTPELARIPATTTQGLPLNATYRQVARRKSQHQKFMRWRRRIHRVSMGLMPPIRKNFYVDYGRWLRRELRGWAEAILLDPRTLGRGYWNDSAIPRLVDAHLHGNSGNRLGRQLTALISFELWHRMYVDARGDQQ